jgi:gamma-glutamyltranspeptidase
MVLGALLILLGIIVYVNLADKHGTMTVENVVETPATATSTEVTVERDLIDEAKAELERINAELDAEEMRLLEEKAAIEAEAAAKLEAVEKRLEQIRETRVSFQ